MKTAMILLLLTGFAQDDPKPPKVGDKAPPIKVKNQANKDFDLAKVVKKGWVVLAFYPMANTPG